MRWLGLAVTPDNGLWATVTQIGEAADGTSDPDPTLTPTQEIHREDVVLENHWR